MNQNPLARSRIPLSLILLTALFAWGIGIPARADTGGPVITDFEFPYPIWHAVSVGSNEQDAFKLGDQYQLTIEVKDDAPIASAVADFSELGVSEPVPMPLWFDRDAQTHLYQVTDTVGTHPDGPATILVTVTDTLGRTATVSKAVQIDNAPPAFSIDSLAFKNRTTAPAIDDTLLVSGSVGPTESKVFVTDTYYSLYAADGTPVFIKGTFRAKGRGVALSDLGIGSFTDDPVQVSFDLNTEFHIPDAAFISITATVIDGAGNSTTTTSPLFPIPHAAIAIPAGAVSNVLFLPGIEGSRLYSTDSGAEEKIWDPSSDADLAELSLDASGKSVHDVYAKEGGTIDSFGPFKFYSSFVDQMNGLKDAGAISDWRAIAYDWRLSPGVLVNNGAQHGMDIDYGEASSTPYIVQTLRALAATSKTGKVTIVAHSAGGLVAKALMEKLGDAETARLIDTVVFVGVPQSGTPQALAGLLHGYGSALPADWCASWEAVGSFCAQDASRAESRALAKNMPMAYDLLPSSEYFTDVKDALHPVVSFAADHLFALERSTYGFIVQNESELTGFATAAEGGRIQPAPADLSTPNILNANLIGLAGETHDVLDTWTPPPSVRVYQIAGWGADTLSGIEYYETQNASGTFVPQYRPQFVEDGDSTVTIPSALMMPLSDTVTRYWINLTDEIGLQPLGGAVHENLLEMRGLRELIQNILTGASSTLPEGITIAQPADINPHKKLLFTLHGRVHAMLKNSSGQSSVLNTDGSVTQGIPGVEAGRFGDTGFMLAPVGDLYELTLSDADTGAIDLDVQQMDGNTVTSTDTFAGVPAGAGTQSIVDVSADGTAVPMQPVTATSTSTALPSITSGGGSSRKIIYSIHTKGIANSKSVLKTGVNAKPVVVKVPKAATTKAVLPKAKPLTKKAKTAISALLDELTAELQGLLTKLPH